jgi:hypothetical protein
MATRSTAVQATSQQELENMVASYIAQGYNVANRTPSSVTMIKRKQFSVLWAVIGFIVCVLPLLIYLIVYALEDDQMVIINLGQPGESVQPQISLAGPANTSGNMYGTRSPDGRYWWDGTAWRPISATPDQPASQWPGESAPRTPDSGY